MRSVRTPLPGRDPQRVRPPFAADAHALALDFVTVFCRLRRRGVPLYGAGPDAAVGVLQGEAPLAEAEYELFAPAGTVFDADQECHSYIHFNDYNFEEIKTSEHGISPKFHLSMRPGTMFRPHAAVSCYNPNKSGSKFSVKFVFISFAIHCDS